MAPKNLPTWGSLAFRFGIGHRHTNLCRRHVKQLQESKQHDIEVFLNSVPLLSSLSKEEKQRLADAMEEQSFTAGAEVIAEVCLSPLL